jgi:hypothetical protein
MRYIRRMQKVPELMNIKECTIISDITGKIGKRYTTGRSNVS